MTSYCQQIKSHYVSAFTNEPANLRLSAGPVADLPKDFCVLEFAPHNKRQMWIYATCCMSTPKDEGPLELHLCSPYQCSAHLELLTAIAHYHRTGHSLGLGHTVNFGRPWLFQSECTHGLISLPYLYGPRLEWCQLEDMKKPVRCLWLIPITLEEREFKKLHGLEALEKKFEELQFNYLDPDRSSVVVDTR